MSNATADSRQTSPLAPGRVADMSTTTGPEAPAAPAAPTSPAAPPAAPHRLLVPAAAAVTVVLWGSAFIGIRSAGFDYSPGALALGRIFVGTLALTVIAGLAGKLRLPRGRTLVGVVVWGVLWFGLYNLALNAAERTLDAGTASLLVGLAPILIAVFAGISLGEGFPARLLAGIGIAFAGVAGIALATSSGASDVVSVLLGLAAAVIYAGSTILQKRLLPQVDSLTMTWLGCLAGTVVCLPFLPVLVTELAAAPTSATLSVVYLGVFPTAIAFVTWGYALTRTTAGRLGAATYAAAPLAVLMSWALLGEVPTPVALAGGALCLAGVLVATLRLR
ncbi:DMT family transporter [Promicromonospora sukumoe]|uniref:Drug/metabolite transporter (DMT)-like permease n=1 Tax=Promicromonospora sukumoe TaxID=88382 RepID=A0A7W3JC19_9MICO|nr:DMT family transporter [Promicromonospora sukumoe]MBA8810096.1 drug/metabolite transporter (DMT)-like permease [Promicromonospora sukumoe]